jgi:CO/xanthine dehydrogenase FAD-binding subunit
MHYRVAKSLDEALELLRTLPSAKPVAGGTDLAVLVSDRVIAPSCLVDLAGVAELRGIRHTAAGTAIGPATTIAEIAASAELPACLVEGARAIGSPQVRNVATIGGNVCNASPCGDTLAPLVALGATFTLAGRAGRRDVPAEQFFTGPKKTVLAAGELLVGILVPAARLRGGSAFATTGKRNGQAISQANAAVWVRLEAFTIVEVRAAVGSVAPVPLRLPATEARLAGSPRSAPAVAAALEALSREIKPISDVRASADYRTTVTASLFRDALQRALEAA